MKLTYYGEVYRSGHGSPAIFLCRPFRAGLYCRATPAIAAWTKADGGAIVWG